jgi:hypothetical protein
VYQLAGKFSRIDRKLISEDLSYNTSAFAKRYVEEPGSDDVVWICLQTDQLS